MHHSESQVPTATSADRVLLSIAARLPSAWTPIGARPRDNATGKPLRWQELPGAPLGIDEAQKLVAKKCLVMANRHEANRVVLVVRPAAMPAAAGVPVSTKT